MLSYEARRINDARAKFTALESQRHPQIAHEMAASIEKDLEKAKATTAALDPTGVSSAAEMQVRLNCAVTASNMLAMMRPAPERKVIEPTPELAQSLRL